MDLHSRLKYKGEGRDVIIIVVSDVFLLIITNFCVKGKCFNNLKRFSKTINVDLSNKKRNVVVCLKT